MQSGDLSAQAPPSAIQAHPRLGQWLGLGEDGTVRAYSGKVDLGQGITHALRLIVAAELGVGPACVVLVPADTRHSPDEGVTSGSLSVQQSGAALRWAAAQLRERCRAALAQRGGVAVERVGLMHGEFVVDDGAVRAGYHELADAVLLDAPINSWSPPTALLSNGSGTVAQPSPRPDIAAKVYGEFRYIHDLVLPGMLFGQVFRPNTLTAELDEAGAARLLDQLDRLEGVVGTLRDGLLIGVLATGEGALVRAADRVERQAANGGVWTGTVEVPAPDEHVAWLKAQPIETTVVLERRPEPPGAAASQSLRRFHAEYSRPWLQHASIGLSCAIAQWSAVSAALEVRSHSQGIFNLRRDLALAFGLEPERVSVAHVEAAGCYGHNGGDDVAFDAAWLARLAPGRPVRVQWSRRAELAHAPLAPAMAVAVEAAVDPHGQLVSWSQQVWSQGHGTRPGRGATPALLGAWQTAAPAPIPLAVNAAASAGGGAERNAVPPYSIAEVHVVSHRVLRMPLRVSAMRSLGAHANVFAAESLVDEIAVALDVDPLAFRLAHLQDAEHERAVAVLEEVARISEWAAGRKSGFGEGVGRGIAFARYKGTGAWCAVVVELEVHRAVALRQIWIAADVGAVVHPDGVRNQLEGGAVQAASWTLMESAAFDPGGVRSNDWTSYPIFRFQDVPPVQVQLVDRPRCPSLGAGECTAGPVAAAIANAVHAATGVRMRSMPFTPDRLMQCAQMQGDQ